MQDKRTKIICTMGPATESDEVLRELIKNGMNVARFNFSHGSHAYHRNNIDRVRRLSDELGIPVAILLDTKGPEIRTGELEGHEKVELKTGEKAIITTDDGVMGTSERFSLDYKEPSRPVTDFFDGQVRFAGLKIKFPETAKRLFDAAQKDADERWKTYVRLRDSLNG
jgi:pyruvate kinase